MRKEANTTPITSAVTPPRKHTWPRSQRQRVRGCPGSTQPRPGDDGGAHGRCVRDSPRRDSYTSLSRRQPIPQRAAQGKFKSSMSLGRTLFIYRTHSSDRGGDRAGHLLGAGRVPSSPPGPRHRSALEGPFPTPNSSEAATALIVHNVECLRRFKPAPNAGLGLDGLLRYGLSRCFPAPLPGRGDTTLPACSVRAAILPRPTECSGRQGSPPRQQLRSQRAPCLSHGLALRQVPAARDEVPGDRWALLPSRTGGAASARPLPGSQSRPPRTEPPTWPLRGPGPDAAEPDPSLRGSADKTRSTLN